MSSDFWGPKGHSAGTRQLYGGVMPRRGGTAAHAWRLEMHWAELPVPPSSSRDGQHPVRSAEPASSLHVAASGLVALSRALGAVSRCGRRGFDARVCSFQLAAGHVLCSNFVL